MSRSKSSSRWLREHFDDVYVKKAQAEGLRSRAVYKLEELIDKDRLLKPGMRVVDLGAAPGGWSQLVRQRLGDNGTVVAMDILPMQGIAGVDFLQGDFREESVLRELESRLQGQQVDLVLSDMAPNMSGVALADQIRAMDLAELAFHEDVGLLAYSPLAAGAISGKYLGGVLPAGTRGAVAGSAYRNNQYTEPAIRAYIALAEKHGLDVCQMAIAFCLTKPFMTSVIIGATNMEQLRTNIGAADVELSEAVLNEIQQIFMRYPRTL